MSQPPQPPQPPNHPNHPAAVLFLATPPQPPITLAGAIAPQLPPVPADFGQGGVYTAGEAGPSSMGLAPLGPQS